MDHVTASEQPQQRLPEGNAAIILLMMAIGLTNLVTGMFLPVLPSYLTTVFHQGNVVIGLLSGLQFASSLVLRIWAGTMADRFGPRTVVLTGLSLGFVSGLFNALSIIPSGGSIFPLAVLILARVFLGGAMCFVIVGSVSWALGLAGQKAAGAAIAWMGMAIYVGLAIGAPLGSLGYDAFGFGGLSILSILLPLAALACVLSLTPILPDRHPRGSFRTVLSAVSIPGLGLAFSSFGYGAVMGFLPVLFTARGWNHAWLAFTIYSVAFILARILMGRLPDRLGGARVSLIFSLSQAIGLLTLALADTEWIAFAGIALNACSYSLIYPGLGLEAVRRAPFSSRGTAIGAYTGFLELTLGVTSPLLGLLANDTGIGSVFFLSGIMAFGTTFVCLALLNPLKGRDDDHNNQSG